MLFCRAGLQTLPVFFGNQGIKALVSRMVGYINAACASAFGVWAARCGQIGDSLSMMQKLPDIPLEQLITDRYFLEKTMTAFKIAASGQALKVLLVMESSIKPYGFIVI